MQRCKPVKIMAGAIIFFLLAMTILMVTSCAHHQPVRAEQQEMGAMVWLVYADEMDAEYAMQIEQRITALEDALALRTEQRDFWFQNYEERTGNNYEEARQEEDYQVDLILGPCCEGEL